MCEGLRMLYMIVNVYEVGIGHDVMKVVVVMMMLEGWLENMSSLYVHQSVYKFGTFYIHIIREEKENKKKLRRHKAIQKSNYYIELAENAWFFF